MSSGGPQLENRHLGSNVEAHMQKMADTAADVQAAARTEVELAGSVKLVAARQQWRTEKRRFALSAVRVA